MAVPTQVTFRDLSAPPGMEALIYDHVARLERMFERITCCRVIVASAGKKSSNRPLYSIRIDVTVPAAEIIVNRDHHVRHARGDPDAAARDAFRVARRKLEDHVQMLRSGMNRRTPEAVPVNPPPSDGPEAATTCTS